MPTKAPTKTIENGWRLRWGLGLFRTENSNDIISVASAVVPNFGFFQNAGTTLRQGVEAKVNLTWNRWSAYANYTFIDATYQSFLTLPGVNNLMATIDPVTGSAIINVIPGDHIPGIPAQRLKLGAEYDVTDAWKLGGDPKPVPDPRRFQPQSQGTGLLGCQHAHVPPNYEKRACVRAGAEVVQPTLLLFGHVLRHGRFQQLHPRRPQPADIQRSAHVPARNAVWSTLGSRRRFEIRVADPIITQTLSAEVECN